MENGRTFIKIYIILSILGFGILLSQCKVGSSKISIPDQPYERLSQYNFFEGGLSQLIPRERVLPYDLNSPLFSDYAHKARFVWMPEGESAMYTTDHVLEFPVGAVLIKNFFYNRDERNPEIGRNIIETRLLVNRGEEWDAYNYVWNEDQNEAFYDVVGEIKDISWIDIEGQRQRVDYIIPNKNQCKGCHAYDNKQMPIGPKVRNLNKDFEYTEGSSNQLVKWSEMNYLNGFIPDDTHPKMAVWDDPESGSVHDRAMAYLDINCGHCHNPKGAGNTSGLTLLADSSLGTTIGIYKPTVSAGAGTGGFTYSIVPGNPRESIMIYRMKSNNPGAMMPEIGRRLIHNEGVALIAQWIREMDPTQFDEISNTRLN